jgi:gliding motility-associated-like protein
MPVNSTNYHVQVTANNGCKAEDSVLVTIKQKPVFTISPVSTGICKGEYAVLTASGGDVYQWSPSATILDPNSASVKVFPLISTTYKVIVTDNICNVTDSLFAIVSMTGLPNTTINKSNDVDCVIGEAKLTATGGVKYVWSPASSLSNAHIANPVATPDSTTTYHVKISNANGCMAEDSIQVKVIIGEAANGYLIPSAFTPNGDGINDCFGIRKWGFVSDLDFTIYNKSGNMVFHTTNAGICWNGNSKGIQQSTGVYIYQIRAKTICGVVNRKGTIILIR